MAAPEEEISALAGRALRQVWAEGALLKVTVAGAGARAGMEGELDQTRAIDSGAGIATPEIGRAEEALGDGHRVGRGLVEGAQMLFGEPVTLCVAQEAAVFSRDLDKRVE
jgi:hypothetical protein